MLSRSYSVRVGTIVLAFLASVMMGGSSLAQSTVPVPLINDPLVPTKVDPGGPGFTLTVNGAEFIQGSVVNWNGSPLATNFVSGTQLMAIVPASNIAGAGTASVTVGNPGTTEASNVVTSGITFPISSISLVQNYLPFDNFTPTGQDTIVVADFNGDGKADFAAIGAAGTALAIYIGNGDGTFQGPTNYTVNGHGAPQAIRVRDFNGDGKVDLAVLQGAYDCVDGSVDIFLGNGDGTFQQSIVSSTNYDPHSFAVADFNGDGKLDIAVTDSSICWGGYPLNGEIAVLLGNGDGTFVPVSSGPQSTGYGFVVAGDFNGDGIPDLAAFGGSNMPGVSVFLGNGDGTFQTPATTFPTAYGPVDIEAADLNGDGKLDLAVVNACGTPCDLITDSAPSVSVLLGNGDGTFHSQAQYTVGYDPTSVAIGDFNGDGIVDLAVGTGCGGDPRCEDYGVDALSILLGNGDGTFQPQVTPFMGINGNVNAIGAGDLNGDGLLDLVRGANGIAVSLESTLAVSTNSLTFGYQTVGTSSQPKASTLNNISTKVPITVSGAQVTGTNASDFSVKTTCSKLWAKSACKVNVTFKPTAPGARTATVVVTDSAVGSPHQITVTGTGRHRK